MSGSEIQRSSCASSPYSFVYYMPHCLPTCVYASICHRTIYRGRQAKSPTEEKVPAHRMAVCHAIPGLMAPKSSSTFTDLFIIKNECRGISICEERLFGLLILPFLAYFD